MAIFNLPSSVKRLDSSGPSSAVVSAFWRGDVGRTMDGASRRSATNTTPANTSTKTAIASRAIFCQRICQLPVTTNQFPVASETVGSYWRLVTGNYLSCLLYVPVQGPDV